MLLAYSQLVVLSEFRMALRRESVICLFSLYLTYTPCSEKRGHGTIFGITLTNLDIVS